MTTVIAWTAFILCIVLAIALALVWANVQTLILKTETPAIDVVRAEARHRQTPVILFKPPMLGGMTIRDWLRYHWASTIRNGDDIWAKIVDEFYDRAYSHPVIRPYFEGKDIPEIKRKFLATLLIVTHSGVTDVAAETLTAKHAHLGITGEAYDETVNVLVKVLNDYGIPSSGTNQLVPMLLELRKGLVTT